MPAPLAQTRACPRDRTRSELTGTQAAEGASSLGGWSRGRPLCPPGAPALTHLQARPLWSRCWAWPESSVRFSWPRASHEQAEHAAVWPWRRADTRLCAGSTVSVSLQVRGELGTLSRDLAVSESCVFPDLCSSQRDVCA